MRYLLPLVVVSLTFSACLEDERNEPAALAVAPFTAEELAVLNQELTLGNVTFEREVALPDHIAINTAGQSTLAMDPADLTKALLGRVLFYDTQLSATGETSCATCHKQELAFGDDLAFSKGINGGHTKRNSIALASVPSFATEVSGYGETSTDGNSFTEGSVAFFWDERAATIKEQSTLTIQDRVEMGRDLNELADDLKRQEMYRILSRKAFGSENLTGDRITLALEKFCATISSMDSPFDDLMDAAFGFVGAPPLEAFSEDELHGQQLFNDNCSSCHGTNLTQPFVAIANNGLDRISADAGVGEHRGSAFDGVFKVPFLRNVALTAPYMHDGRFATLREVVDHYSEGIQDHGNLHFNLRENFNGAPRKMNFTEADKQALIAFLELTTDRSVLVDASLSDPFRR
ncbi:cytochrome c peroxidase [Neolewinella xylanilytica]|uniref:Cytochrome c peroxidase n=1 Tax=Neolewinella xylanilytica TaxID=1514080 RepID=A0A2S6IA53_9BACT|nr:cytochrome c peroxidase [Neolewinella xylanilytica]PPK88381.1 cytochrome c peroxidase [Neolewinella xylanilytica]